MKDYIPSILGVAFVLGLIGLWAMVIVPIRMHAAKHPKNVPDTVYVENPIETYEQLMVRFGRPYMFRDGVDGGTTTWQSEEQYIDLVRRNDTAFVVYRRK